MSMKRIMLETIIMASMLAQEDDIPDELAHINIMDEYELIKQKKSNLSARLRKMVQARHEKIIEYQKMQEEQQLGGDDEKTT